MIKYAVLAFFAATVSVHADDAQYIRPNSPDVGMEIPIIISGGEKNFSSGIVIGDGSGPVPDDEGQEFVFSLPPRSRSLVEWVTPGGSLVARVSDDGSLILGEGFTSREAAIWAAGHYSLGELVCANRRDYGSFLRVQSPISGQRSGVVGEVSINLRTDGAVEYSGITPSTREYDFFRALAELMSCEKSTSSAPIAGPYGR